MGKLIGRLAILCGVLGVLGALASPAWGTASDPLFIIKPEAPADPKAPKEPPPTGYLEGPCGLVVSPNSGNIYVSDYYHHAIDIFGQPTETEPKAKYEGQTVNVDSLDGPCGLAMSGTEALYVNNFHRNVLNLSGGTALPLPAEDTSHHLPTGIAIDPSTGRVYVDNRTYITAFESDGSQVMDGAEPLRIGLGTLVDGYGMAATAAGRLYVADGGTNTVKVYEPAINKTTPGSTIKGPAKGFVSLRDSSLAIDGTSGNLYVVDNQQPAYTEEPQAVIDIFNSSNGFLGVLKYKVFDALPVGIAVDNSGNTSQGRVFVTSGNTDQAAIYMYGPNAQTNVSLPPAVGAVVHLGGTGKGSVSSASPKMSCSATCSEDVITGSTVTLEATPREGSEFSGWSGVCSGTAARCTVTIDEESTVGATFTAEGSSTPQGGTPTAPPLSGTSGEGTPPPPQVNRRKTHRHHRRHHHRHSRRAHRITRAL